MFKKLISMLVTVTLVASSFACAFGVSKQVTVAIPKFPVTLNELKFNVNEYERYPLLVYRDITYFPMTFHQSNLLNLDTSWSVNGGLVITKSNLESPKEFAYETPTATKNRRSQVATIIDSKVKVNGKAIENKNEPYPLLHFRNITYFPMTWRFAVEEFGWKYEFDNKAGLRVKADNFFYTANGDSFKNAAGEFVSVQNETHYIKGALRIYINTETNRMGPVSRNLHIVKNGKEIVPEGYFGYYQKNGPLFTIDGNHINTTYYTNPDMKNSQPCKVEIETGEIKK